jgi:biotin synthase
VCYAIPGRVVAFQGPLAVVDYFGERRTARNELDGLRVGDYIYAQGGYVIESLPEAAALEILQTWKETFFELQAQDWRLSRLAGERSGVTRGTAALLDRVLAGRSPDAGELLRLLRLESAPDLDLLFKTANFLRQKHLGNSCCVHGVLEISNVCGEGCGYCGLSRHNQGLVRARLDPEAVAVAAVEAVSRYGFKALVLQGGEDPGWPVEELCRLVAEIKRRVPVLVFVSFGEVGREGLEGLYAAGARGLLMRFETSDPELYARLHPGSDLRSRLDHLEAAFRLGYLIITGGLIGLPGQTDESLVRDLLLARDLHAEMYSFGPFLPHPGTPLAGAPAPDPERVLKVLALARLVDPQNAKLLVTTAFETLDPDARRRGLMVGANSVMLNVTPEPFRPSYALYPNRAHDAEGLPQQIETTLGLLRSLGRAPTDLGVSAEAKG